MRFNLRFLPIMGLTFSLVSFAGAHETVTYKKDIKSIISARCLSCHGSSSPTLEEFSKNKEYYKKMLKGPRLDTYEELIKFVNGSDAGALMRRLDNGENTKDGKPGNMYEHLGNTEAERHANLETFKKWVGNWTLKKKAEMTEEDLKAIRIPRE